MDSEAVLRSPGRRDTPPHAVDVSFKMMPDYREESPLREAAKVALAWTPGGDVEVMSVDAVGSLSVVRRQKESPSGWVATPLAGTPTHALTTMEVEGQYDRVFAIDNAAGGAAIVEWVHEAGGGHRRVKLGQAYGNASLSVGPCDDGVVAVSAWPNAYPMNDPVFGLAPSGVPFWPLRMDNRNVVKATKIAVVADAATRWPHPTLVSLYNGVLAAWYGVREEATAESDQPAPPDAVGNGLLALVVEPTTLPPLARVQDFAVLRTTPDAFLLLAIDGGSKLYALAGSRDAAVPGPIRWAAAWNVLSLTGDSVPSFRSLFAQQLPGGRVEILLRDGLSGNLWSTSKPAGLEVWDECVDLGISVQRFVPNVNDLGEMVFAGSSAIAFTLWSREGSRDWRPEPIHLAQGARIRTLTTYRAVVSVSNELNAAMPQLPLLVRTSDDATLVVGKLRCAVGPERPAAVSTDAAGMVTMTLEIGNSIYSPVLVLEADWLPRGHLEVRADSDAQEYLRDVSWQALLDGSDPQTGVPLMRGVYRNETDAKAVARTLSAVCALADAPYLEESSLDCPVRLAPRRGVRWVAGPPPQGPTRLPRRTGEPWRFSMRSARPVFTVLSAAEWDEAVARTRPDVPGDFLGLDWGAVCESVKNGISDFVEVVVNGTESIVTFVVNGIEKSLHLLIDTVAQVFDLVASIFDAIGTVLGVVVGWLLSVIGFLFGWDHLKQLRDELRQRVLGAAQRFPTMVSDPLSLKAGYRDLLQQARSGIREWLAELERRPIGQGSFHQLIGEVPALPALLSAPDNVFVAQGTWLLDRALEALGSLVGEYGLPSIPGVQEALAALTARAEQAAAVLAQLGEVGWKGTLEGWIESFDSFEASSALALFAPFVAVIDKLIDVVEGALDDLVTLLHLAYTHIAEIVQWVDREVYVPFLSAFYREVLGNPFSLLDLVCLMGAIFALGWGLGSAAKPTPSQMELQLLIPWVMVTLGAEAANVATPRSGWTTLARVAADVALMGAGVFIATDHPQLAWRPFGTLLVALGALDAVSRGVLGSRLLSLLVGISLVTTNLLWCWHYALESPISVAIAGEVAILSACMSLWVASRPEAQAWPPLMKAGYAVLQAGMTGSVTGIYGIAPPELGDGGEERSAHGMSAPLPA